MLTNTRVHSLPNLKHVWHGNPHRIFSFQFLRLMDFCLCTSLESLIPASIAQQLPQLEHVELVVCSMEHIIHREGTYYEQQDIEEPTFVFPRLERIQIWRAPRLSSFYPGQHTIDWPELKHVSIMRCPNLEVFKSQLEIASQVPEEAQFDNLSPTSEPLGSFLEQLTKLESASSSDQLQIAQKWASSTSQPLLSIEEVLTKLESVSISNQQLQIIQELELPDVLSSTLKEVHFEGFDEESANLPINFLERFPNLEKIIVIFSDFVELFTCEILDEEKENMPLSRIQHLDLRTLTKLEHIWNPQSKLDHILNNLLTLRVWMCHSLVHLATPFASFCNLTTLDVGGCQGLVSLFIFSTTTSLVQLREITVARCEKLTEIIAVSDEETEREAHICFNKLEILKLSNLGSITSFCSNATLKFPLLAQLIVEGCPNMELFSSGYLNAPKLKTVWQGIDRWKGDLNTTIRQLYAERRLAAEEIEKASESSQP